jgi:hypothetical protein
VLEVFENRVQESNTHDSNGSYVLVHRACDFGKRETEHDHFGQPVFVRGGRRTRDMKRGSAEFWNEVEGEGREQTSLESSFYFGEREKRHGVVVITFG